MQAVPVMYVLTSAESWCAGCCAVCPLDHDTPWTANYRPPCHTTDLQACGHPAYHGMGETFPGPGCVHYCFKITGVGCLQATSGSKQGAVHAESKS